MEAEQAMPKQKCIELIGSHNS